VTKAEACPGKWKHCDEESQTCPEPWDDLHSVALVNALVMFLLGSLPLQAQARVLPHISNLLSEI
jgi:hypothetical protein